MNRDTAELIVEKLNFELTAVGNYPTDKVVHLIRQLGEFVWDVPAIVTGKLLSLSIN